MGGGRSKEKPCFPASSSIVRSSPRYCPSSSRWWASFALFAAHHPVPGDHASHRGSIRFLSRRQRPGSGRHGGRSRRAAGQRRREHDLHVLPVHNDGSYKLTVTFKVGTDLNIAQVLVQNRVTLATPVLPDEVKQPRRAGHQEVAQHVDDRQPVLARWQPRQPVPEQLRHHPAAGRTGPAPWRGRHQLPGTARLQYARVARSGENGLAQLDRQRRGRRPSNGRTSRWRPDRSANLPWRRDRSSSTS